MNAILLARHPHVDGSIGSSFAQNPLFKDVLTKSNAGIARLRSLVDGHDRVIAGHVLPNFPAVIAVGTTVEAIFAEWQNAVIYITGAALLMLSLIGGVIFLSARQVGNRLREQNIRLDAALNNMSQGLCMFDAQKRLVVCNDRYAKMYWLPPELLKVGTPHNAIIAHRILHGILKGDQDDGAVQKKISALSQLPPETRSSRVDELADGRLICVTREPMAGGGWVALHENITEQKRADAQIVHMAHHDALTDLPNRVLFYDRLENELAHVRRGGRLAILYLDLDHFKRTNDTLGHSTGDELLKSVAGRLRECVRDTDIIARLGGDEFAIIQTALERPSDAAGLATRIREAIRPPYDLHGHQVVVDVSIGISIAPDDASDRDQLLKNADMALFGAKAGGRGTYCYYEPDMDARMKARRKFEMDLRQGLVSGEFELFYQPVVDLARNEISGCEALLRWRHPERGLVSPSEFIQIAEEIGLIIPLGEWVLRKACADAASWPNDIKVAVNLSPAQLASKDLLPIVINALATSGLPADRLEFEITESVLMQNTFATLSTLHQLRELKVRIAMDDFGTGYSSLSYLRSFPFNKIKIDRSFIVDLSNNESSHAIVRAITGLARDLNMTTTAEGVETQQQLDLAKALGCTEMQGFFFSPPKPLAQIMREFLSPARRAESAA